MNVVLILVAVVEPLTMSSQTFSNENIVFSLISGVFYEILQGLWGDGPGGRDPHRSLTILFPPDPEAHTSI